MSENSWITKKNEQRKLKIIIGFQWVCIVVLIILCSRLSFYIQAQESYYESVDKRIHDFKASNNEQLNILTLELEDYIEHYSFRGRLPEYRKNHVNAFKAEINQVRKQNWAIDFVQRQILKP